MKFEELPHTLVEFINPKRSIWVLQHKFITKKQCIDETIAQYALE